MLFAVITFIAAFLIEGLGTIISVLGLSTLFGANPIIIGLAIALDIGKLVVVSLLYTYWKELNRLMKAYALIAAAVTMIITSAGAAGYLSARFQEAVIGVQAGTVKVEALKQEQVKLEARKKQIDDQIANLPANTSRGRVALIKQFKDEQQQLTARINEITKELPTLQVEQINVEAKAGPILYVAKAFNISVEEAVKWVILMIIFVFDPLAVFLIIAGNFLLRRHRELAAKESPAEIVPQLLDQPQAAIAEEAPPVEIEVPVKAEIEVPIKAEEAAPAAEIAQDVAVGRPAVPDIQFTDPGPARDVITLSSLRQQPPAKSTSFDSVSTDETVMMDQTPHVHPDYNQGPSKK